MYMVETVLPCFFRCESSCRRKMSWPIEESKRKSESNEGSSILYPVNTTHQLENILDQASRVKFKLVLAFGSDSLVWDVPFTCLFCLAGTVLNEQVACCKLSHTWWRPSADLVSPQLSISRSVRIRCVPWYIYPAGSSTNVKFWRSHWVLYWSSIASVFHLIGGAFACSKYYVASPTWTYRRCCERVLLEGNIQVSRHVLNSRLSILPMILTL